MSDAFRILLLKIITFLSAFLMFQIELIIAKTFLPYYGGSYLVWGSCIVFFQAALLAGYLAAHNLIRWAGFPRFRYMYLAFLLIPLLFFPGRAVIMSHAPTSLPLALDVFVKLVITIGPVFFTLSTVSITTQVWLASSNLAGKNNPYFLYSVSNAGSLAGLISYPFFFEYIFSLSEQQMIWRTFYLALLAVNLIALPGIRPQKTAVTSVASNPESINIKQMGYWLLLGAAGVVVMLSVNNILTAEIAPIPLLWIAPLGIYLVSFILNFKKHPWCPAFINENIVPILGGAVILFPLILKHFLPILIMIPLLLLSQFLISMYCQNRLIAAKPANESSLSLFYVLISIGGFIGGIIVTWLIPMAFNVHLEFPLGLGLIAAATGLPRRKDLIRNISTSLIFILALIWWVETYHQYDFRGLLMIFFFSMSPLLIMKKRQGSALVTAVCFLIFSPLLPLTMDPLKSIIHKDRNFYGIYKVFTNGESLRLVNNQTLHGFQMLAPEDKMKPTSYYSLQTPLGEVMSSDQFHFQSIGAIGLGAGTVSALTREDQTLDFYELDPLVYKIADQYFTFLADSPAKINYHFGDARVSLAGHADKRYDLLIIDAFSGDTIPVHLINLDAARLYQKRLNPDGVIMFHISNKYIELGPVVDNIAQMLEGYALFKENPPKEPLTNTSIWSAVVWNKERRDELVKQGWTVLAGNLKVQGYFPVWTDEYSSIFPVIRYHSLINEFKKFRPFYWP